MRLASRRSDLSGVETPHVWLLAVTHNAAVDAVRRSARRRTEPLEKRRPRRGARSRPGARGRCVPNVSRPRAAPAAAARGRSSPPRRRLHVPRDRGDHRRPRLHRGEPMPPCPRPASAPDRRSRMSDDPLLRGFEPPAVPARLQGGRSRSRARRVRRGAAAGSLGAASREPRRAPRVGRLRRRARSRARSSPAGRAA